MRGVRRNTRRHRQLQHRILEGNGRSPRFGGLLVRDFNTGFDDRGAFVGGNHLGPSNDLHLAGRHRRRQLHIQPVAGAVGARAQRGTAVAAGAHARLVRWFGAGTARRILAARQHDGVARAERHTPTNAELF